MALQSVLFLLGGIVLLAVAGDYLVNGATALAERLGLSQLFAGIFVVGFGTSAPEMIVVLQATLIGHPEMALGNIVGSNIANVWLALALPALIVPIACGQYGQRQALTAMLLATLAWMVLAVSFGLTPLIGLLFLCGLMGYAIYTYVSMRAAVERGDASPPELDEHSDISTLRMIIYLIVGIVGLPLGANLIVTGGVNLAKIFNVSEELIGLTLLAIGTSLPEIGAALAAARRGRTEIMFGNVLGSNLFNILGGGGLIAFFGPIAFGPGFTQYSHWALAASALMAGLYIVTNTKVGRLSGLVMLILYAIYIVGLTQGWRF